MLGNAFFSSRHRQRQTVSSGGIQLSSWKEIADYFGVSIKTVQNWEKRWGLPVSRMPGSKGRVIAALDPLRVWKETRLQQIRTQEGSGAFSAPATAQFLAHPVSHGRQLLLLLLLLGAIGLVLWTGTRAVSLPGSPASYHIDSNTLIVCDKEGREVWRRSFADRLLASAYAPSDPGGFHRVEFADLDREPGLETLFVYQPVTEEKIGTVLVCFSPSGKEKWRFEPGRAVSDQNTTYSPFYSIANFKIADLYGNGASYIVVTSHHLFGHPNQVAVLDSGGTVVGEYWHSGHLEQIDVEDLDDDCVPEILLGGVNNGYQAATLIVLNSQSLSGASLQLPSDPTQLNGFPPANEKARLLFGRTCINRQLESFNRVSRLTIADRSILVDVRERLHAPGWNVVYHLDRNFNVRDLDLSDQLSAYHFQLESMGQLDHALSQQERDALRRQLVHLKPFTPAATNNN